MRIGSKDIKVHAWVIPRLALGLLLGMNTVQDYQMDVLLSKKILMIGISKIPLVHRRNSESVRRAIAARRRTKVIGVVVLLVKNIIVVAIALGATYHPDVRQRMEALRT